MEEATTEIPVMAKHTERVRIEEVDWLAVFPWLRLFKSFRMAMHPVKLLTALLLVTLLYVGGKVMDGIAGAPVVPGELQQYREHYYRIITREQYDAWRQQQAEASKKALAKVLGSVKALKVDVKLVVDSSKPFDQAVTEVNNHYLDAFSAKVAYRGEVSGTIDLEKEFEDLRRQRLRVLAAIEHLRPRGVFASALDHSLDSFNRLMRAGASLRFGWGQVTGPRSARTQGPPIDGEVGAADNPQLEPISDEAMLAYDDQLTVVASLRDLFVVLPGWLIQTYPVFFGLFLFFALIVFSVLGGAVARMAALDATHEEHVGPRTALRYSMARWWSFLATPLAPLVIVLGTSLLLMAGGFVLFNPPEWGIDILGGIVFIAAILCGLIIALTIVLTAGGAHLFYPAVAIDGADPFDALARSFNYVLNRPWRWLFYTTAAMVHGAITYLFVSFVVFALLWVVQAAAGFLVFTGTTLETNRFDAIFPPPRFGQLSYVVDYTALDWSGRIAAWVIRCWNFFVIGLLPAFVFSYYLCASTWIYLLLRRSADGVEIEDVAPDALAPIAAEEAAPAKVEPAISTTAHPPSSPPSTPG